MIELLELIAQFAPSSWRSLLPIAIGIGSGLAIYFISSHDIAQLIGSTSRITGPGNFSSFSIRFP